METYTKLNKLLGWLVFLIATIVYFLTLEPTASWWDCGEYIATAYKLQVGHPPGAPLFQLLGRFFTLFAFGDVSNVAMMINAMSALSSSFTILFLFWTITMLARKLVVRKGEMTTGTMVAVLGSGVVGALAFTFSDSFWFSAVEGEVYAMSSFFTAITFWAILRWERVAGEKHALRWIILIAFLVGLSIGVHMLNLLAIPAIAFVYYFKKYKPTVKGGILTLAIAMILLSIIMFIIIPGIVSLSTAFELFFVNSMGMPFNSGTLIYFAILLTLIILGLIFTRKHGKVILNTIILSFVFILIGYSSFMLLIIRSNENTPIDENSPEDAIALLSYLNREQYGDWPILSGQYYTAPIVDYDDGNPLYVKDREAGRYKITNKRVGTIPVYDKRFTTIFPRMWSNRKPEHKRMYNQYARNARSIEVDGEIIKKPSFGDNLGFFFDYQLGHMYFRYFMWNFAGRQNDVEAQPGPKNGNWISGFEFIDNARLGGQYNLPESMKNPAHNKFYLLPLLLGLAGLFFHLNSSKRDTLVVALLFLMTGIVIVLYLNQYPYQPRERDYAYTGSFYAFSIWIGLGVLGLYQWMKKYIGESKFAAGGIALIGLLLVPGIMAQQGWDDHDRSGKYATRDFAMNYLVSCDPNAILITNGDNDTFPLWYVQEVEDFRTDIRVVNYMLSSGYWYVHQLGRKVYDSEPLPLTLTPAQYEKGVNQYIMYVDRGIKGHVEVKDLIDFIASDNEKTKLPITTGDKINYMPAKKLRLTVDSAKCVDNGIVPREMAHLIVPYIEWEIKQDALYKNDLMLLDFLATNNWERPMYFANPYSLEKLLAIDEYCHLEGNVYKFMPVKAKEYIPRLGGIHADKSYDIIMNDFRFGNLNDPSVTVDRESYRNARVQKQNYLRIAQALLNEGKPEKAAAILDTCIYYFRADKIHYDIIMMPFIDIYYSAGRTETATEEVRKMLDICDQELTYFLSLDPAFADTYYSTEMQQAVTILQRMTEVARENDQLELSEEIEAILLGHMEVIR
jgi:succinate dehydrogenase flavin-adding protein (antitoxin of CptAB toxin-antitoxin module)